MLVLTNASGKISGYASICKIASIKITGSTYNDDIEYIDEPIDPTDNCEYNCEKAIRMALPVGKEKVNIKSGDQSIGSGTVIKNKFGMIVVSDSGKLNPTFISTCKIYSIE